MEDTTTELNPIGVKETHDDAPGIYYFKTYVGAALKAFNAKLISETGLVSVICAAKMELKKPAREEAPSSGGRWRRRLLTQQGAAPMSFSSMRFKRIGSRSGRIKKGSSDPKPATAAAKAELPAAAAAKGHTQKELLEQDLKKAKEEGHDPPCACLLS